MAFRHLALVGVLILTLVLTASAAAPQTFTLNLNNPYGPSITGNGWGECKEDCGYYCAITTNHYSSPALEPGYYFNSDFTGQAECTLTVRSTGFSTSSDQKNQDQEWVQGYVNGIAFGRTPDICTGGGSCGCNVATATATKTITLQATNNRVTVRRGWDSVAVKGGELTCTEICEDTDLDEYQCRGSWTQILHQNSDCSTDWEDLYYCEYGCYDGECIIGCDPGYTNNTRCNGNWLQREYLNYDCTTSWHNYEYCHYSCSGNDCNPDPEPFCEDTDGGIIYSVQGNTYGVNSAFVSYSKSDYCTSRVLTEYYCNGTDWASTQITCDESCQDGRCVDTCSDQCDYVGQRECDGDDALICGYYDGDVCLDWDREECDEDCDDGYCVDDCDTGYTDDYRCYLHWRQRYYINRDCEGEWRDWDYCENGCYDDECWGDYCGDGYCNNGETCYNCQIDCGICYTPYCGDNICNNGETCATCPNDCGACDYCGDGTCQITESCLSCEVDCGSCTICGDGLCEGDETCSICSLDCGVCDVCGDGVCTGYETCLSCESDCGLCLTPCGIPIGEDVEVTEEACIVYTGVWSDTFNITIYSREGHSTVYQIHFSGEAERWASVQSPSVRIPEFGMGKFIVTVTVPEDTEVGTYTLSTRITSGGDDVYSKNLTVTVAEPPEGSNQTGSVVTIGDSITGAVISGGEVDLIWVLIAVMALFDGIILLMVFRNKRS